MKYYRYKDHTIYPTPRFSTESGKWKMQITIRHKTFFKIISTDIAFTTEEEASANCIEHGKQMIDAGIVFLHQA